MRIFSPEVETETKLAQELCQSGDCFKYDLYQYNTAHIEGADYEEGGEYNYQEVSCWHSKNRKLHIDGKEIEEVMEKLILSCETRAQI